MPRRFEVVCRDLLSRAKLRELAKVAVPLAHQLDGTTRRETRFLEFKQGAYDDDRWYGSVIDGIDERHRSGSFSTWRWLRPPGSRATSERWR